MTKLRACSALRREAAGKGADFVVAADVDDRALEDRVCRKAVDHSCRGRSKFRPLRRHKMQASSTEGSKGQKALNDCLVWDFSGARSGPVTAAVAGFSSAPWPEFGPPYTRRATVKDRN